MCRTHLQWTKKFLSDNKGVINQRAFTLAHYDNYLITSYSEFPSDIDKLLENKKPFIVYYGLSIKNPRDRLDKKYGRAIALSRYQYVYSFASKPSYRYGVVKIDPASLSAKKNVKDIVLSEIVNKILGSKDAPQALKNDIIRDSWKVNKD